MNTSCACPQCRGKISPENMSKDQIPEKIIDDLQVACPNDLCEWKDRLELFEKHVKNCKIDKELPNWARNTQNFINHDVEQIENTGVCQIYIIIPSTLFNNVALVCYYVIVK